MLNLQRGSINTLEENLTRQQTILESIRDRVKHSTTILSNIFHQLPDLVYFKDKNNNIIEVNDTMCKVLGVEREELLGDGWIKLAKSNSRVNQAFINDHDIFEHGITKNFIRPSIYDEKDINGNQILYFITKFPLMIDNEIKGVVGVARRIDILCTQCGRIPEIKEVVSIDRSTH